MKRIALLITCLLMTGSIYAQQSKPVVVSGPVTVVTASEFHMTKPLKTMFTKSEIEKIREQVQNVE